MLSVLDDIPVEKGARSDFIKLKIYQSNSILR